MLMGWLMMKSRSEYRITVNGIQGKVEPYPARWSQIADAVEERGGHAILERRMVTDLSFLEWQPENVMILKDKVVTYWEILAELEF